MSASMNKNSRNISLVIPLVVAGLVLVIALGASVFYFVVVANQEKPDNQHKLISNALPVYNLKVKDETFALKIAADRETQRVGLGGVTSMGTNEGMIFVFQQAKQQKFWMKDCKIALDIIFVRPDGIVDSIHTLNPPPSPDTPDSELETAHSTEPSRVVIELNAGRAKEIGLRQGDRITINYFEIQDLLAK